MWRLRSLVDRQRWRCRRQSSRPTATRPGHRQNTVRLGERHIDDEAERQAAQEEIAMTIVRAGTASAKTTTCAPSAATAANGPTKGDTSTAACDAVSGGGVSTSFETPWKSQQSRFCCTLPYADQMGFLFIFKNKHILSKLLFV